MPSYLTYPNASKHDKTIMQFPLKSCLKAEAKKSQAALLGMSAPSAVGKAHTKTCYPSGQTNPFTQNIKTRTSCQWGLLIHGPRAVRKCELTAASIQAVCPHFCSRDFTCWQCTPPAYCTCSLHMASCHFTIQQKSTSHVFSCLVPASGSKGNKNKQASSCYISILNPWIQTT